MAAKRVAASTCCSAAGRALRGHHSHASANTSSTSAAATTEPSTVTGPVQSASDRKSNEFMGRDFCPGCVPYDKTPLQTITLWH